MPSNFRYLASGIVALNSKGGRLRGQRALHVPCERQRAGESRRHWRSTPRRSPTSRSRMSTPRSFAFSFALSSSWTLSTALLSSHRLSTLASQHATLILISFTISALFSARRPRSSRPLRSSSSHSPSGVELNTLRVRGRRRYCYSVAAGGSRSRKPASQ
jgi:hypothetical protein